LIVRKKRRKIALLVAIEGIDQSGKETQSRLLANRLREEGRSVDVMDFPDYTTGIGRYLREYLHGKTRMDPHAVHLLYAANKWESLCKLDREIRNVDVLIMNRYRASNLAYGVAHGLPIEWLSALEHGLPEPDVVLVLDVSPRLSFERKKQDRDVHENERAYLVKVRRVYLHLAKRSGWIVINGARDREDVHAAIWRNVSRLLK
jgi:dTMP kinase